MRTASSDLYDSRQSPHKSFHHKHLRLARPVISKSFLGKGDV